MTKQQTYTHIHSFMTLSQRFDPNHDTCVTRLRLYVVESRNVWRRRVPWGLVVLARGSTRVDRRYQVTAAATSAAAAAEVGRLLTQTCTGHRGAATRGGAAEPAVTSECAAVHFSAPSSEACQRRAHFLYFSPPVISERTDRGCPLCGGAPARVAGCGDARVAPPCPTTLCVWRNLPYLTLPPHLPAS